MNLKEIGKGDVDWAHLSQNRHKWRAVVKAIKNVFLFLEMSWFSLRAVELLASGKGLCSMYLVN